MKWRLPGWHTTLALIRARVTALGRTANALLAKVLRPKVGRALAVLFFLSVIGVAAHAASMSASVTLTAPPNELGLMGYWPLNSSDVAGNVIYDESGKSNNATTTGALAFTTSPLGQSAYFNGSSYVQIPSSTNYDSATGAWTFWIKTSQSSGNPVVMGRTNASGSYGGLNIFLSGGTIGFQTKSSGSVECSAGSAKSYADNKWHLVVMDYAQAASATETMYVDGQQVASCANDFRGAWSFNSQPVRLARSVDSYWNTYAGSLADVHIYNRTLSTSDIQQLYSQGNTVSQDNSPSNLLTNGLVGYWTFDGANTNWTTNTTADISGHGNTGHLVNLSTTTSPVLGRFGQAMSFNGTSQYLTASGVPFEFPNKYFTVSAWIKAESGSAGGAVIAQDGYSGGWFVLQSYGAISFQFKGNPGPPQYTTSNLGINDGKWHLITAVCHADTTIITGNTATIYVDGKSVPTTAVNFGGAYHTTSANLLIANRTGSAAYFPGSIDDVRIYNRALSATEVQQLYNAGAPGKGVTIDTAPTGGNLSNGLVGYWPFDGNTTSWLTDTTKDTSGSGITGYLKGMSTTSSPVMGVLGQALNFGSQVSSGYVNLGTSPLLDSPYFTLSAWIDPDSYDLNNRYGYIYSNDRDVGAVNGTDIRYYADYRGGLIDSTIVNNGTRVTVSAPYGTVPLNKWSMVTSTYDGSSFSVYVNGALQNSTTTKMGVGSPATYATAIGGLGVAPWAYHYIGGIDDMRIYNRALSASEVQQLYNLGR